jgi:hypothetical protein
VPLTDLIERGKRGDDPTFYYSYLGAADWFSVPWVTPQWIERVRRQLATAPARFARLIENRVAAADDAFISDAELADAIDPSLTEPERGAPGVRHSGGMDVGLNGSWTAVKIGHANANGQFILDVSRHWIGTPGRPVDLDAVEREIVDLHKRFPLDTLRADPWQAVYLAQRLERQRIPISLAPVDAARVDRLTTSIKGLFVRRLVKFGAHLLPLREQLEAMTVTESKSRGLLRFEGGGKSGAGAHSDLVFALGLACEGLEGTLGRLAIPNGFRECYKASSSPSFQPKRCYVFHGEMPGVSGDPSCRACIAHSFIRQMHRQNCASGGTLGLREFRRTIADNDFVSAVRWSRLDDSWDH